MEKNITNIDGSIYKVKVTTQPEFNNNIQKAAAQKETN